MPDYSLPPASLTAPLTKAQKRLVGLLLDGFKRCGQDGSRWFLRRKYVRRREGVTFKVWDDCIELGLITEDGTVTEEAKERMGR